MDEKQKRPLSEEELVRARKILEDFGTAPIMPVVLGKVLENVMLP